MLTTFFGHSPHNGPADVAFLQEQDRRDFRHAVARSLHRVVTPAVLGDATVLSSYDGMSGREIVALAGDALVLLRIWRNDSDVCASAATPEAALRAVEEIRARVTRTDGDRAVEVTFYDAQAGNRTTDIAVRPWAEIADLYPRDVRAALDQLVAHVPDVDEPRRLVLWHGVPGTGKTTAVRALLHAWRPWADGLVVTDPERLLTDGRYLRRVLLDAEDDRWKAVVVEDADAIVTQSSGAALGTMLNLADGLLGQGLRCLFLLTTNAPPAAMHAAVTRPGRCLARVEFTALSAAEAARVLGRPVDRARTLAEVLAQRTVTNEPEPVAVGQYL